MGLLRMRLAAIVPCAAILMLSLVLPAQAEQPASQAEWEWKAQATIRRHIRVPRNIRRLNKDHMIMLRMSVSPAGSIRRLRVERSSGYPMVDQTVLTMVRRIENLPPFSPDMGPENRDLRVPIQMIMR